MMRFVRGPCRELLEPWFLSLRIRWTDLRYVVPQKYRALGPEILDLPVGSYERGLCISSPGFDVETGAFQLWLHFRSIGSSMPGHHAAGLVSQCWSYSRTCSGRCHTFCEPYSPSYQFPTSLPEAVLDAEHDLGAQKTTQT